MYRTRVGVTVFDLARGRIEHRWSLPVHARLQDTDSASFVYTVGTTIHVHRLLGPLDHAFPLAGVRGPVEARLTDAGLFVAWEDFYRDLAHVAFVPRNRLPVAIH